VQIKKSVKNIITQYKIKMETKKENWKTVIKQIELGKSINNIEIVFDNDTIPWKDAMILGKNGIKVPQKYIDYDDDNIDYSDIPPITNDDISTGKIRWKINAELSLEKEITDWIKQENIDLSEFASKLIRNFYESVKYLSKKAAF